MCKASMCIYAIYRPYKPAVTPINEIHAKSLSGVARTSAAMPNSSEILLPHHHQRMMPQRTSPHEIPYDSTFCMEISDTHILDSKLLYFYGCSICLLQSRRADKSLREPLMFQGPSELTYFDTMSEKQQQKKKKKKRNEKQTEKPKSTYLWSPYSKYNSYSFMYDRNR